MAHKIKSHSIKNMHICTLDILVSNSACVQYGAEFQAHNILAI